MRTKFTKLQSRKMTKIKPKARAKCSCLKTGLGINSPRGNQELWAHQPHQSASLFKAATIRRPTMPPKRMWEDQGHLWDLSQFRIQSQKEMSELAWMLIECIQKVQNTKLRIMVDVKPRKSRENEWKWFGFKTGDPKISSPDELRAARDLSSQRTRAYQWPARHHENEKSHRSVMVVLVLVSWLAMTAMNSLWWNYWDVFEGQTS